MNEADFHLKQTRHLIDDQPSDLVLTRLTLEDDGAGGHAPTDDDPLDPQTVRIVGIPGTPVRMVPDGREVIAAKSIVGMPDLDVEIGDVFVIDSYSYEIVMVSREPGWRTIAQAAERA